MPIFVIWIIFEYYSNTELFAHLWHSPSQQTHVRQTRQTHQPKQSHRDHPTNQPIRPTKSTKPSRPTRPNRPTDPTRPSRLTKPTWHTRPTRVSSRHYHTSYLSRNSPEFSCNFFLAGMDIMRTSWKHPEKILKTFWEHPENILRTSENIFEHLWTSPHIPYICKFWYTTTLFRPAKSTPKNV